MVVRKGSNHLTHSKQFEKNGVPKKKALLVAQEISLAKVLAGNEKKLRDRGLKRLKKWLTARTRSENEFNDDDFMRIWKGLFYSVWMSDKPLIQEELCENISSLLFCFGKSSQAFSFMRTFFHTIALEWNGIDQHRINKFYMLVRRFLRQCLIYVDNNDWAEQYVEGLDSVLKSTYFPDNTVQLKVKAPGGLVLHFSDIFLEELAKASKGNLAEQALLTLLKRFALHLAINSDRHISEAICSNIFDRLIEQSPEGIEYSEKFSAWRKLGFPGDSLHCMERVDEEDEDGEGQDGDYSEEDEQSENSEQSSEPLDPRAGKVDVLLPSIVFIPKNVEEMIKGCQFKKFTTTVTRNTLGRLARKFGRLSKGNYPLGYYRVPKVSEDDLDHEDLTDKATTSLQEFQQELLEQSYVPMKEKGHVKQRNNLEIEQSEDVTQLSFTESLSPKLERNQSGLKKGKRKGDSHGPEVNPSENVSENLTKVKKTKLSPISLAKQKSQIQIMEHHKDGQVEVPSQSSCEKDKVKVSQNEDKSIPTFLNVDNQIPAIGSSVSQLNQVKSTEALKKISLRKERLSVESCGNPKSSFIVSELLPASAVMTPVSKTLKSQRRASLPAKLKSEGCEDGNIVPDSVITVGSRPRKLKRKSDPWAAPLQAGETEIIITKEMLKAKRKSLPLIERDHQFQLTDKSVELSSGNPVSSNKHSTPGSSKKVNFVLQRNSAQGTSEYFKTLRENPEIPFDAKKRPSHGVLKSSPYSSPINPFYLRKMKQL